MTEYAPDITLYSADGVTLTLDALRIYPGCCIQADVSCRNDSGEAVRFALESVLADNALLFLQTGSDTAVQAGETVSATYSTDAASNKLLEKAGFALPGSIRLAYSIQQGSDEREGISQPMTLPNASGISLSAPEDTALYDSRGLRIDLLSEDLDAGSATLLLSVTEDTSWSQVRFDAVFDGYRASLPQSFELTPGAFAAVRFDALSQCPLSGLRSVGGIDVYLALCDKGTRSKAEKITIGAPKAERSAAGEEPFYEENGISIRYLGSADELLANREGMVFEVENTTDTIYYLYPTFSYAVADGEYIDVFSQGEACYPGVLSRVYVFPEDTSGNAFGNADRAQLTLSLLSAARQVPQGSGANHRSVFRCDEVKGNFIKALLYNNRRALRKTVSQLTGNTEDIWARK